jgi:hypothetical protein
MRITILRASFEIWACPPKTDWIDCKPYDLFVVITDNLALCQDIMAYPMSSLSSFPFAAMKKVFLHL